MKTQIEILTEFLDSSERPEGTLNYHQIQGFLFAISCSPQLIKPSEWMPLIFNEQEANYQSMDETQEIMDSLIALYNVINHEVLEGALTKPADLFINEIVLRNIGEQAPLGQWSAGFLMGHDWLSELWNAYIPEELNEELGGSTMILSLFANDKIAQVFYQEFAKSEEQSLSEYIKTMLTMFDDAMNSYAHIGRSIYMALQEVDLAQQPFVNGEKTGRNDPCPCGSGKKYKKCCLH